MAEIKTLEAGKLLCLEGDGSRETIDQAFRQLDEFIQEKQVATKSERMVFFYDDPENLNFEQAHFGAAKELAGEVFGNGEVLVVTQAITKVACQLHRGSLDTIKESYQTLTNWINENGYQIVGAVRECVVSPDTPVIEIQIPVTKMS